MFNINTAGRLTILLGQRQARTGVRCSLRQLAQRAEVSKDLVYRLDAGQVRELDLDALGRLCRTLQCRPEDILTWEGHDADAQSL